MIKSEGLSKIFVKKISEEEKKKEKKKRTSREFYAVNHVDLQANSGEILGILGPNGAGKTTLLRMMGNLMQPTEGNVIITDQDGTAVLDMVERKKRVGYLSGNTKLYHRFSVREMLFMLGEIYGLTKEETSNRAEEIIRILSMEEFADNRIEVLSTGQTQRANIARCLIHEPEIYIFDEPTLGLDIISSDAILQFMKQEKERGKTILYSTHYMEEAQYLCDRIVMLYEGSVIADDTPKHLMEQTGTDNLRDTFHVLVASKTKEEEATHE